MLPEGKYTIHYGSGSSAQMLIKKNVEILQRYKTVVEPDWGVLMVDILDEERNYAKVRYEIFDAESGESFGGEFPADEATLISPVFGWSKANKGKDWYQAHD